MGINRCLSVLAGVCLGGWAIGLNSGVAFAAFVNPLTAKQAMVVSAHPLATEAGVEMLRQGGNAVDSAVATTLAISVVEPFAAGIGGGGFLLFHEGKTGKIQALDFRERAPLKATRNMYVDPNNKVRKDLSINGHLAVATPGTIAGLYEVHRRYGKLSWSKVVQPAIKLAREGFVISPIQTSRSLTAQSDRLKIILANPAARAIFTRRGEFYQPGERLVQRDLAHTLTQISRDYRSFYSGKIGKLITADMQKNGGLISLEDLRTYKPIWREPVCSDFRNHRICSMPPPSSGGIHLLQILNIIGDTQLNAKGWHHPDYLHLLTEAMKIAYADRSQYLGDPDFVQVPVTALTNPEYAKIRRSQISPQFATPAKQIKPAPLDLLQRFSRSPFVIYKTISLRNITQPKQILPKVDSKPELKPESMETSHLNVVDQDRNAVSLTFTINTGFGAGVVAAGTGILLNNEMDDFAIAPNTPNAYDLIGNDANAIAPRKTPLSSMTPTIVTNPGNNKLHIVVGTPGGSTIITQVLQIILNVLEFDMDAGAAVSAPRIHHQWLPDQLRVEKWGMDALTMENLRDRGHQVKQNPTWGNANLIIVKPNNTLEGAADPRGEGAAGGF